MITIEHGDCLDVLADMLEASVEAIVTDPPYELGFMGRKWDSSGVAFDPSTWAAALRVLKPGGHLVAFGAPKNYHRLACAIEDAGFEIRDSLMWVFGSGFPKSLDVSKAIDKATGAVGSFGDFKSRDHAVKRKPGNERQHEGYQRPWRDDPAAEDRTARQYIPGSDEAAEWQGWGTALKPAYEPIILARRPLAGTVAETVLAHGTGALNINACRVEGGKDVPASPRRAAQNAAYGDLSKDPGTGSGWDPTVGRWPANLVHDGSEEVLAGFPETKSGTLTPDMNVKASTGWSGGSQPGRVKSTFDANSGSAARFFYCAKAGKADRAGSKHPTVKPIALMRWLVRLITPPGGVVLDPFAGSGTTGQAAMEEGFDAVLIEREAEYIVDIERRMDRAPKQETMAL